MKENVILQWLLYRGVAVVLIAIMSFIIYDILLSDIGYELQSLYMHGDIIVFNMKAIAGAAGIPVYIYAIFLGLRVLFTKSAKPPTTQTSIGVIFGSFCAIATVLGFILAFLISIGLMFSPYSNCHEEKLGAYYVTDLELCKAIIPKKWFIKKDNPLHQLQQ